MPVPKPLLAPLRDQKFPGFDTDTHGLVADEAARRSRYFVDRVAQ